MTNSATPERGKGGSAHGASASLPWLLRRVNRRYRANISDRLAEAGLAEVPQPGYWALTVLGRGGSEAGQLMAEMGVSKQAVSKLVDALVSLGLVERRPNRDDRRRTDLFLSERGRRAAEEIEAAARSTDATLIAVLGEDQFASLVETLAQLADGS